MRAREVVTLTTRERTTDGFGPTGGEPTTQTFRVRMIPLSAKQTIEARELYGVVNYTMWSRVGVPVETATVDELHEWRWTTGGNKRIRIVSPPVNPDGLSTWQKVLVNVEAA